MDDDMLRPPLPRLVGIGALSGFIAAWLLAIELAAIQGTRALLLDWLIAAPLDPEIRPFTVGATLATAFMSLVWYSMAGARLRPHRVSVRWYLGTVGWGLACVALSVVLAFVPAAFRWVAQTPALIRALPMQLVGWGVYGLAFGLPIVLLLSPIVVWIAEQAVLRNALLVHDR